MSLGEYDQIVKKAMTKGLEPLQVLEGIEGENWEDQAETQEGKEQHRNEGQRMVGERGGLGPGNDCWR